MRIHIRNLDNSMTKVQIRNMFVPYGDVESVSLVNDVWTGGFVGAAIVEMVDNEAGETAITATNGQCFMGHDVVVSDRGFDTADQDFDGCKECGGSGYYRSGSGSYLPEHQHTPINQECPSCSGTGRA